MSFWISVLLFTSLARAAGPTAGPTTLEQLCGPASQIRPGQVLSEKCQAAYLAGQAALIENNNTYVHGSAAVVCAYSCMSGGFSSCGGGGGACSAAAALGHKAYADDRGSTRSFEAAQRNGTDALGLVAGPNKDASFMHSGGTTTSVPPPPSACASAAKTRSVNERIACAAATDPSLPAFVSTPQFQADFQKITGYSLQDVYFQNGGTLVKDYAPNALSHAYGMTKGKSSFSNFVKAGMGIMNGIMGALDPTDRETFQASVLPGAFRGLGGTGKPENQPRTETVRAETVSPADAALNAPLEAGRATASASNTVPNSEDEENQLGLSLFERVSVGYRRAFQIGRL